MYLWSCGRRQFVDFIANRRPLHEADVRSADDFDGIALHNDDILLVWQRAPVDRFSLPRAAIIAEGSVSDFLAWVSTYFRHIRPFTAHCRLLTPSLAQRAMRSIASPSSPNIGSADVGLILAEGIAYSVGKADLNRLPFSAFARTLSFALSESVRRYEPTASNDTSVLEQVRSGWLSARELTSQAPLSLSPVEISGVWGAVLAAAGEDTELQPDLSLVEALKGVRATGRVQDAAWANLTNHNQGVRTLVETMEGPREGRVRAVEAAVRELIHGPEGTRKHRAFILGYMASRVQPGSLDHFPLVFPAVASLRESLLWYGACAGLSPETSVDNYGNGLGWLMRRELGRPAHWLDRPSCDIALSEMSVLLRNGTGPKPSVRTLASGALNVELFPLISTSVKWSEHSEEIGGDRGALGDQQRTLFAEDARLRQEVLELLRKIDESSMSLDAIRRHVESAFGEKNLRGRKRKK